MTLRAAGVLVAALAMGACQQAAVDVEAPETIQLRSEAFPDGGEFPQRHTCDGEDVPPALAWSGVPEAARELALIVEDPDAPRGVFVHWVVAGLPPDIERLDADLPAGAVEGRNGFGDDGYGGPCPPEGDEPHRYELTLFAADRPLGLGAGASAADLHEALDGAVLAQGRLTGIYGR